MIKYLCHECSNKDCIHRQKVSKEDFGNGIASYCSHGFIKKTIIKER